MSEPGTEAPVDGVAVNLDGRDIVARKGELLIDAAERHGVYIPHFCYHPRMAPVGMCRMCLVEVDTGRGPALQPSCMLEVAPDMKVSTDSPTTKKAQDGVLEFLLINHPLDCPVCDKGGECPLQDQTLAYGPGESRFVEEKRHLEKPIPISDLVNLDRERCILCDRCTRFAKEVAGDPLIHFLHRGSHSEVNTFPDEPFSSYFSGNTVQICPVGALTAVTYRFKARPWDLESTVSTCQACSVGCRISVESSRNEVLRFQGVDVDPVNWGWLCDKGRFGFEAVEGTSRLADPLLRRGGELVAGPWSEALATAAGILRNAIDAHGPAGVGVIGGSRLTNEAAYAWTKLAKGVIGTDNVDAQLADGLPARFVAGVPRATIDEACRSGGTVVVLAPDLKEELPVLFLRLRHAVVSDGVRVIEVAPRAGGVTPLAAASLRYRPGEPAEAVRALVGAPTQSNDAGGVDPDALTAARAVLAAADGPVTLVLGRPSVAEDAGFVVDAATALLDARPEARVLSALRRGNVHGAIDMGMAPGLLPGRVDLTEGGPAFAAAWGQVPTAAGMGTAEMLRAATEGRLGALVLVGADPLGDVPDRALVEQALAAVPVVAVDATLTESSAQAQVVLPAAEFAETDGTTTNLEGRISVVRERVTPPGSARPDWMLAAELARALGADLGVTSPADLRAEVERLSPLHAGLSEAVLDAAIAGDGVVVPLPEPTVADAAASEDEAPDEGAEADEVSGSSEAADEAPADGGDESDATPESDGGDEAAAAPEDEADDQPASSRPPMIGRPSPEPMALAAHDAYGVRLVATRKLYDLGTMVQSSPHLATLPPGTRLSLNPYDFDRRGVEPGDEVVVTVTTAAGGKVERHIPVVPDAGVPRGAGALEVRQPGFDVHELLDLSAPVVTAKVDPVGER